MSGMGEAVAAYSWLNDATSRMVAACVTVVVGGSREQVLAGFGVEPGAPTMSAEEAVLDSASTVGLAEVEAGIVAVEFNGYQASRPEVLRTLAARNKAASAYWNVNALTRVSLAQTGRLLSAFEAGATTRRDGEAPAVADALMADLDFQAGQWNACMLVMVERFTGVQVTSALVASIDRVHLVTPVLQDPPVTASQRDARWVEWAGSAMAIDDHKLANLILAAEPRRQREFAIWAAVEALIAVDLISEPPIVEAVAACRAGAVGPLPPGAANLIRTLRAAASRLSRHDPGVFQPETRASVMRHHATAALQSAASRPDPDDAAVRAATEARLTFWDRQNDFLHRAQRYLA